MKVLICVLIPVWIVPAVVGVVLYTMFEETIQQVCEFVDEAWDK